MNKKLFLLAAPALLLGVLAVNGAPKAQAATFTKTIKPVYRLYNRHTKEYLYTESAYERDVQSKGSWTYQGVGWSAPTSGKPVYRLYNPNQDEHLYTMSAYEVTSLVKLGWQRDNGGKPVMYSGTGGSVKIYRDYNPKDGQHFLTANYNEYLSFGKKGWNKEGVKMYGESQAEANSAKKTTGTQTAITTRKAAIARLNALRATKGRHDTLTKGDGSPRPAVREDAEMDKWAQTRANELAKSDSGLSHADDSNGEPAWDKLVDMTKTFPDPASLHGPECLAMRWGAGLNYGQALQMWWDEYKNPNGGVGHYLTMVNPSYNVAGIGIATSKDGTHYAVLEMTDKHPAVQGNTIKPTYTRTIKAVDTKGKVIKTLFKQTLTATATLNLTTQKYSWDKQSLTLKGYNDSDFPTIPGYTYIREQGDVYTTTFNPADDPFGDDYGGEGTAIYEANSLVPTLSLNQTVNGQSTTYFYKFTAPKDGWYVLKYSSDTAATGVPSVLKTPSISSGINNELSPYGGVTSGNNYMNPVELSAGQTVYVWTGPQPSKDTVAMATPVISKYVTVNETGVGGTILSNTTGYTKDYSYTEVTASKGTDGNIVLTQTTYNCWFKNSY